MKVVLKTIWNNDVEAYVEILPTGVHVCDQQGIWRPLKDCGLENRKRVIRAYFTERELSDLRLSLKRG